MSAKKRTYLITGYYYSSYSRKLVSHTWGNIVSNNIDEARKEAIRYIDTKLNGIVEVYDSNRTLLGTEYVDFARVLWETPEGKMYTVSERTGRITPTHLPRRTWKR